MLDVSAAPKKYPLYRLAIISLELLDRKLCEMHPSWLSFAVKLTAFFGYFFFAVEKKLLAVGPPPTTLTLKLKQKSKPSEYPIITKS